MCALRENIGAKLIFSNADAFSSEDVKWEISKSDLHNFRNWQRNIRIKKIQTFLETVGVTVLNGLWALEWARTLWIKLAHLDFIDPEISIWSIIYVSGIPFHSTSKYEF